MPSKPERLPDTLWHYTSAANLLRLIEGDSVHATSFQLLNDATEVAYAHSLLTGLLSERLDAIAGIEDAERVRAAVESWQRGVITLPPVADDGDIDREGIVGVFSLSRQGDQLSQWRAYGGEAGVALGFNREGLGRALNETGAGASLARCVYGASEGREVLGKLADTIVSETQSGVLMELDHCAAFFQAASRIKDEGFREEAEWRVITRRERPSSFALRAIGDRVTAYVPIRLVEPAPHGRPQIQHTWGGLITHVRVGPARTSELTRKVLEPVLRRHLGIDVQTSSIPFRP